MTEPSIFTYELGKKAYDDEKYDDALKIWLKASEEGDLEAQYYVALTYYNLLEGEVEEDQAVGFQFLLKAAQGGFADAQHALGVFYQSGDSSIHHPEPDDELSKEWLIQAAEAGSVRSMIELGIGALQGVNECVSLGDAKRYLDKAHFLGEPKATNALGVMHQRENDIEEAIRHFELAANAGYKMGSINLARLFLSSGDREGIDRAVRLALECSDEIAVGEVTFPDSYYAAFDLLEKLAVEPYDHADAKNALGERAIRSIQYTLLKTRLGEFAPVMEDRRLWENIVPLKSLLADVAAKDMWIYDGTIAEYERSVAEAAAYFLDAAQSGHLGAAENLQEMTVRGLIHN